MSEHTPTPWAADPDDREDMEWNIHIVEASQPHMRVCFMTSNGPAEANAAFIVEAVNNHETLKAEITRLRSELEQAKGQVESLRNALEPFIALRDQSPTQMAKVIHKGIAGTIPIALTVTKDQFKAACSAFGLSPSPSSTELQGDGK